MAVSGGDDDESALEYGSMVQLPVYHHFEFWISTIILRCHHQMKCIPNESEMKWNVWNKHFTNILLSMKHNTRTVYSVHSLIVTMTYGY